MSRALRLRNSAPIASPDVTAHAQFPKLAAWERWSGRRPQVVDAALALAFGAVVSAPLVHGGESRWWVWLFDLALVLPLIARRRWPFPVFAFVAAIAFGQWMTGVRIAADAALLIAMYTVVAHESRVRALLAVVTLEIGVILASIRFAPEFGDVLKSLVLLTGMVAAALFIGTTLRTRREFLASVVDRAERLEREREQQAQLAATAERTRIAREMHDIIAHSLSVIIALSDGAALATKSDDSEAAEAIRQVSVTGRQALQEMRRLLGVLRDEGRTAELAPQPGLERIDELIGQIRSAGLPISLTIAGRPTALPPTTAATVYRIVQESLTNSLKHASEPHEVQVRMEWRQDCVTIDISDDGRACAAGESADGHGLPGMRERAAMFGGTLSAGPRPDGGWRVLARLPLAGQTL